MGGTAIGVPDTSALQLQSPDRQYNLQNTEIALSPQAGAPPPAGIGPQEDQPPSAFQLPPEAFNNQPPQFSQPGAFDRLQVQQQQFQQPQFQQPQGPDAFTPYEQQIQARQDARQRMGGGLKGLLVNFAHGMGTAMMHNAGLLTPEEQNQRDTEQLLGIQNARTAQQYKNMQAQDLQLKMADRVPVKLSNGQTVMVPAAEAARQDLGQQQLDMRPDRKVDLGELYSSSVMNDMMQGLTSPSQRTLQLKQAHADWENKQVSVADRELADYLKDPNVDKGVPLANRNAATHAAWKAKLSPLGLVMGNQLGTGDALDQMADNYWQTGQLPSGFARSPGTLSAVAQRAAERHPEANLASNKAVYKADSTALTQLNKQFEMVSAFEGTAIKNLDRLAQTAKSIPDLGAKFANVPLRSITGDMIGTQNMSRLKADLLTARSESARVLNSANATGVLTNEARNEAEQVLNGNLPYGAMLAAIDELKVDMHNRRTAYTDEINQVKTRLGSHSESTSGASSSGRRVIDFTQ